jgi:hypothetical protein
MSCFLTKLFEKLMLFENMSKPAFRVENHFYPQSWYCGFKTLMNGYKILKYPRKKSEFAQFYADLGSHLLFKGVQQKYVDEISAQLMNKRTCHATNGLSSTKVYRSKLLGDKNLLKLLVKIYYHDFVIFGFDFPHFWT